ncbi:Uncharacterised protein [Sphingobacterium multivorum]|uniref:Uncharacterized protein n=1 Tax=Sphingobacterium multivorum TaxID=28454 RepID=A0A2X2IZK9_SPHMU|nr:Uncharacterised protein [Sphingobacterium multivorum]
MSKEKSIQEIEINGKVYQYSSIKDLPQGNVMHLPFSIRILLEKCIAKP